MTWPKLPLDQLGYVSRGRSRHRPRNDPALYGGPYPFIQTADVKHAQFRITEHSATYSEAGLAQSRLWPRDTLCITIAANIADTALLSYEACFPDSVIGFIADQDKADPRFVKYYFDIIQRELQMVSHGATQDNLSQEKLLSFGIACPPIRTQRQIAEVLSSYDDLIATNQRRIVLLEDAARRLYREWFVHLRYPGHESVPVKDGVPRGWRPASFADLVQINPRTPFSKEVVRPFVDMAALSENSMVIGARTMRPISGGAKFKSGDTLFARITPCTENGKTGFVQFLEDEEAVASGSTEFIVFRSAKVNPWWVYCAAREDPFREHAIRSMAGSDGRQRVNPRCFERFATLQPPQDVLDQFGGAVSDSFVQVEALCIQNERLTRARDLLLPKLMSGQLDVSGIRLPDEVAA